MTFKFKHRINALLITAVLILTFLPTIASASDTLISTNPCIRVLDDGVAVLAHPSAPVGYISSDRLLSYLSVGEGYELSYVDSSKEEGNVSNVTSGYIRIADDSGKYSYLPILTRGETLFGEFGAYTGLSTAGGSKLSETIASFGGKTSDDLAYEFKADCATSAFDYVEYSVPKAEGYRTPYTAVVNVYISGSASAQISYDKKNTPLFIWRSDGVYSYDYNGTLKSGEKLTVGRWHQLSFVYDSYRNRYHVYIDGEFITDFTDTDYNSLLRFGICEGSSNGSVLYDDFHIYRGYYYPSYYEINNENSCEAAVDNNSGTVYYDSSLITDALRLADAIVSNTDAARATVFDDSSFEHMSGELTSSSVVAVTSAHGGRIHYYAVSDDSSTDVSTTLTSGILESKLTSNLGGKVLILGAYMDDRLIDIEISKLVSPGECALSMLYDLGYSYKAFVRKSDFITPVAYTEDIIDTSENYSDTSYIVNDFSNAQMFYGYKNGNIIELEDDTPLGTALHFKRLTATEFYIQTGGVGSDENVIIYEFDIMLEDRSTACSVIFEDDKGNRICPLSLINGGIFKFDDYTASIADGKCHNIAFSLDFVNRKVGFYVDRCLVGHNSFSNINFGKSGAWGTRMKLDVTTNAKLDPDASLSDGAEFYLDNVKAYASSQPLKDVALPQRKISPSSSHNLLTNEPAGGIVTPDEEEILECYESSAAYKSHPRLHATKEDFEALKTAIYDNKYLTLWYDKLISKANHLVTQTTPVSYQFDSSGVLLSVSRKMLENMYTLGMAYQLTGHRKYVDRGWLDLEAVCVNFPDWNPISYISNAEMCAAVAIGYDWMYDGLTPVMRKYIENALYDKGLYEASLAYQMNKAFMSGFVNDDDNRNIVTNSGITLAALALIDEYPLECAFLIKNAIHSSSYGLARFAPDGAWYEGPRYWEYSMQYSCKMLSSLNSVFGTSFGLTSLDGLSSAAEYMVYMQSSNGVFSFGNSSQLKLWCPEMMWLSNEYSDPAITSIFLDRAGNNITNAEDLALALLWYNTKISADDKLNLPTDKFYDDGENELITLRKNWDNDSSFVGIIAGNTVEQMDGASFVYDYGGVRWAVDPGAANYNQNSYWDTSVGGQRWKIFKSRAEAHNTIVTNPQYDNDHNLPSYAKSEIVSQSDDSAIITVDTSELLIGASSGKRGFYYCDDRSSLVVRDEVILSQAGEAYWFMITKADVSVDSSGATLTQDGQSVRLDYLCDKDAQIYTTDFTSMNASVIQTDADKDATLTRIIIKLEDVVDFNLTIKLTPCASSGTDVSAYNIPISNWKGGV